MSRPTDDDRVEALRRLLAGLARGDDADKLVADIAEATSPTPSLEPPRPPPGLGLTGCRRNHPASGTSGNTASSRWTRRTMCQQPVDADQRSARTAARQPSSRHSLVVCSSSPPPLVVRTTGRAVSASRRHPGKGGVIQETGHLTGRSNEILDSDAAELAPGARCAARSTPQDGSGVLWLDRFDWSLRVPSLARRLRPQGASAAVRQASLRLDTGRSQSNSQSMDGLPPDRRRPTLAGPNWPERSIHGRAVGPVRRRTSPCVLIRVRGLAPDAAAGPQPSVPFPAQACLDTVWP